MPEIFLILILISAVGCWRIYWIFQQKNRVIQEYKEQLKYINYTFQKTIEGKTFREEELITDLAKAQNLLKSTKEMCSALSNRENDAKRISEETKRDRDKLADINKNILSKIKEESALLPSAVEWMDRIQEMMDTRNSEYLIEKKNPAPKAQEAVKEANADRRKWKREAEVLKNQIALYESQAPWLIETLDYSLADIIHGLEILETESSEKASGKDPVHSFVPSSEWHKLNESERNQLALSRYFERRQKSPWLAGIAYERYIGHLYEKQNFSVVYQGALLGFSDLGIDLICKRDNKFVLVQCKRLSQHRGIPVRENVIAQTYGASLVYAHKNKIPATDISVVVITSYVLSEEAKIFANALGVKFQENKEFTKYPSIKCNISNFGEKIYHLPFDQQYDVTKVIHKDGDCWAETIAEAENMGFRRAFRWMGNN